LHVVVYIIIIMLMQFIVLQLRHSPTHSRVGCCYDTSKEPDHNHCLRTCLPA